MALGIYALWAVSSSKPRIKLHVNLDKSSRRVVMNYIQENPPRSRELSYDEILHRLSHPYSTKVEVFSAYRASFRDGTEAVTIVYPSDLQTVSIKISHDSSWQLIDTSKKILLMKSVFGDYEEAEQDGHGDGE